MSERGHAAPGASRARRRGLVLGLGVGALVLLVGGGLLLVRLPPDAGEAAPSSRPTLAVQAAPGQSEMRTTRSAEVAQAAVEPAAMAAPPVAAVRGNRTAIPGERPRPLAPPAPPSRAAAPPTRDKVSARLQVSCAPTTALLRVSGPAGTFDAGCPWESSGLAPGRYQLLARATGFGERTVAFDLRPGSFRFQPIVLELSPVKLSIFSGIPDGRVQLDGVLVGTTPAVERMVAPGLHQVTVTFPDRPIWHRQVDLAPGRDELVRVEPGP